MILNYFCIVVLRVGKQYLIVLLLCREMLIPLVRASAVSLNLQLNPSKCVVRIEVLQRNEMEVCRVYFLKGAHLNFVEEYIIFKTLLMLN